MLLTRTPYRISLFGGGSDHPVWYRENGGEVISFAINKYCYLATKVIPLDFGAQYQISYSNFERTNSLEEIKHPVVREAIRRYCPDIRLQIIHDSDLPARSGIGSSSAFAVGLIQSLTTLIERDLSVSELAEEAIHLEQHILKENVGSQDQIACALGGMNYIEFGPGDTWASQRMVMSPNYVEEIESRIVLLYSGIDRLSSDISKSLLENLETKIEVMKRTQELAIECRNIFEQEGDLSQIGPMLVESWELKKKMNPEAITPHLEDFFASARENGAEGGKILGAGGGGFCLFWMAPSAQESFIRKMAPAVAVPIRISWEGSTRIL